MNDIKLLYIIYSKSAKITLSVCVAVGKFVCDVSGGKPVRSFFVPVFKTVRLLNRSCSFLNGAMFLASEQSERIFHRLHWLLDLRESAYMT